MILAGYDKPKEEPFFPGPLPAAEHSVPSEPRFPMATHNLLPPNPCFVGRKDELANIHKLLSQGQGPVVLSQAVEVSGLGIGKTRTALEYCYRYLADANLVAASRADHTRLRLHYAGRALAH